MNGDIQRRERELSVKKWKTGLNQMCEAANMVNKRKVDPGRWMVRRGTERWRHRGDQSMCPLLPKSIPAAHCNSRGWDGKVLEFYEVSVSHPFWEAV